jgi:hypothetical protein
MLALWHGAGSQLALLDLQFDKSSQPIAQRTAEALISALPRSALTQVRRATHSTRHATQHMHRTS